MHQKIAETLNRTFVYSDQVARAIALAVQSGKNLLLYGPGGHGKSEMVQCALSCVADESEIFYQAFGEGMDEATLWGGLDLKALKAEDVLRYHPEQSFLAKRFAVFEELFDAPPVVLLALKDALTAKALRKGAQQYKMKTQAIIACTNVSPAEIAEKGPTYQALLERFPLQMDVKWSSYVASDYAALFEKVGPRLPGPYLNGTQRVLAEVFAKVSVDQVISPRTAVHALGIVKAAAEMRQAKECEKEDLLDLRFLPGLEGLADSLQKEIEAASERHQSEERLRAARQEFNKIEESLRGDSSVIKLMQNARRLSDLQDQLATLKVADACVKERDALRQQVSQAIESAKEAAFKAVRV